MTLRLTILGCGSSGGVPRVGGDWGLCDPNNPKNLRSRCALLVERIGGQGTTRVLVDTGPDMRTQLLAANVPDLDGVIYTHAHADHLHGIDDLRALVLQRGARMPVYADSATSARLREAFAYVVTAPEGSPYPPILDLHEVATDFAISGEGGEIAASIFTVPHGGINCMGLRFDNAVYLPDVSGLPEDVWPHLADLDLFIIDALRREPHPSHAHLAQALAWIEQFKPRHSILTNLHVTLDYAELAAELPDHIEPAFDGLQIAL